MQQEGPPDHKVGDHNTAQGFTSPMARYPQGASFSRRFAFALFPFSHAFLKGSIQFIDIGLNMLLVADLLQPLYRIIEEYIVGHGSFQFVEVFSGQVTAQVVHQLLVVDVLVAIG